MLPRKRSRGRSRPPWQMEQHREFRRREKRMTLQYDSVP